MLDLVAAHADGWEVNLPPVRSRVEAAAARLAEACRALGRDPAGIARSCWIFTRAGRAAGEALAEFRRLHPWFREIPDAEVEPALVQGSPPACRARLRELAADLGLELPVVDLSGAARDAARLTLEACAPG
jgi:alkanesulfonate monooxygenase SsuD/methylene tetrahydromethanopterin reductase-like flavin-dependent oxidoreductase (luciferase family)